MGGGRRGERCSTLACGVSTDPSVLCVDLTSCSGNLRLIISPTSCSPSRQRPHKHATSSSVHAYRPRHNGRIAFATGQGFVCRPSFHLQVLMGFDGPQIQHGETNITVLSICKWARCTWRRPDGPEAGLSAREHVGFWKMEELESSNYGLFAVARTEFTQRRLTYPAEMWQDLHGKIYAYMAVCRDLDGRTMGWHIAPFEIWPRKGKLRLTAPNSIFGQVRPPSFVHAPSSDHLGTASPRKENLE